VNLIAIAIAAMIALPAIAGEGKCTYSTQECLDHMSTNMRSAGWVGIEFDKDAKSQTLLVKNVLEGSPAAAAGLRGGDVLMALNGVQLATASEDEVKKARAEWKPGQQVKYTIQRDSKNQEIALTLGSWPADQLAKTVGKHMLEHAANAEMTSK
jgi:S1-C subfamily serine protease